MYYLLVGKFRIIECRGRVVIPAGQLQGIVRGTMVIHIGRGIFKEITLESFHYCSGLAAIPMEVHGGTLGDPMGIQREILRDSLGSIEEFLWNIN